MAAQHREALELAISYIDSLNGERKEEEMMEKMKGHAMREIKTPIDLEKVVKNCMLRS
jgi:hypothetical protein